MQPCLFPVLPTQQTDSDMTQEASQCGSCVAGYLSKPVISLKAKLPLITSSSVRQSGSSKWLSHSSVLENYASRSLREQRKKYPRIRLPVLQGHTYNLETIHTRCYPMVWSLAYFCRLYSLSDNVDHNLSDGPCCDSTDTGLSNSMDFSMSNGVYNNLPELTVLLKRTACPLL